MLSARSPSSSYSTLCSQRVTRRAGPNGTQPPKVLLPISSDLPYRPTAMIWSLRLPPAPSVKVSTKAPPSPARPPEMCTVGASVDCSPSTSALPLM